MPDQFGQEAAANAAVAAAQAELEAAIAKLNATPPGGSQLEQQARAAAALAVSQARQKLQAAKDSVGQARTADQSQAAAGQRADIIHSLNVVAQGGGQAYGNTMKQVGQGNARIQALAASGRGGLNANLNAKNAAGLNTAAGTQQALAAREAEKTQARGALGQAIAQGQDYQAAQGQATLDALRNQPAAQPNQGLQLAGQLGAAGQAVWSANQGNQPSQSDKNKTRSGW